MTPLDIAAIRARADAATAGPWRSRRHGGFAITAGLPGDMLVVAEVADETGDSSGERDSAFIAAARTDVPALCDEVDRLRAAITQALVRLTLVEGDHVPDPEGAVIALRGALGVESGP